MDIFASALSEAALDTLKALPILYLAYLLVAYFSHSQSKNFTKFLNKSKKAGPAAGAVLGCIPQCGFSSVMSDLYSRRMITVGTLMAVFLATSDEAIPIMISEPAFIVDMLILIGLKIVFALVFGYAIDLVISLFSKRKAAKSEPILAEELEHQHDHCTCHGHSDTKDHCHKENIFLDALYHTLNIMIYIFVATLIINIIIESVGMEALTSWFGGNVYIQILLAGVIGLIPNCAASVFLVELYINGGIAFSALFAGLSVGAGVGLIVLFAKNRGKKGFLQNLAIVGLLYVLGIVSGIIVSLFY